MIYQLDPRIILHSFAVPQGFGPLENAGSPASPPPSMTLTPSGPVAFSANNQTIEELDITADGVTAVLCNGFTGCTLKNCRIRHINGLGLRVGFNAHNFTGENLDIKHTSLLSVLADENENNIEIEGSNDVEINGARLYGGSSSIYALDSDRPVLKNLDMGEQKGPLPRGQAVQLSNSGGVGTLIQNFSNIITPGSSFCEDNISVISSDDVIVELGLVDGNDAPTGVGVMNEGTSRVEVRDVDAIRQGNGSFSGFPSGPTPCNDLTYRRCRTKDTIATDQGRGLPDSGSLAWTIWNSDVNRMDIIDCSHWNLGGGEVWLLSAARTYDATLEDFTLRNPITLIFPWE